MQGQSEHSQSSDANAHAFVPLTGPPDNLPQRWRAGYDAQQAGAWPRRFFLRTRGLSMRPLRACRLVVALVALAGVLACGAARRPEARAVAGDKAAKGPDKKKESADVGDLNAEVVVLQVLHAFDLKTGQLKELATLAAKTAQKPPPRKGVRVSDKYRKALGDLRQALVDNDDNKIEKAHTALDAAREKESPDFDDVEITDASRKQAPLVLDKLSARQVALYVAGQADDFPDPTERLLEGLDESRKRRGKDWQAFRDDLAYQVGWLVAGLDATKEEKVREKATALLNKAAGLSDEDYDEQSGKLRKSARELVGKVGPTTVIRHYVERVLAETLSSHRLEAAVQARLKKGK
jgi:hypothetical protein